MKVFTFFSPSHAELAALAKTTETAEPLLELVQLPIPIKSDGDYGTTVFNQIGEYTTKSVQEIIEQNSGSKIGFCGADIVFLKPFVQEVEALLDEFDVLYQRENTDDNTFNPDCCFMKASEEIAAAWRRWMALLPQWDGHLYHQNHLLRQAFSGLRIGLLPNRFAATMNQGLDENAVLFHANWTPPPGSVAKKLAMLRGVLGGSYQIKQVSDLTTPAPRPFVRVSPPDTRFAGQTLSTLASSGVTVSFGSQASSVMPAQVRYVDSLRDLLQQFQNRPQDANLFASLCRERRMLATRLLEVAPSQLVGFHGSDVGQAHQLLRSSGFLQFPVPAEDGGLVQNLAQRLADPVAINVLLAAMLYRPAHRWPLPVLLDASPDWFVQEHLLYVLACPPLFCESGEASAYAEYLQRWFEYLHTALAPDTPRTRELLNVFVQACNCIGAYFNNANLRSLYTHRAELISLGLRRFGHRLDHTFSARRAGSKIRLGILNAHWTPATETYATLPLFEHLDRSSFEVTLFSLSATNVPLEQYCRSRADHFVVLPEALEQQVETLRQHDLDVLFFGTNLTAVSHSLTLIAMHRLARVQVTSICSPATTGMPMIDCFLAGTLTEPRPDAQAQYREKLCLIEGSGLCFNYGGKPGPTGANVTRAALGLNAQHVVFASGANFFKIIPELRDTWARILAAVPDGVLLLYPFGPAWSNSYAVVPFIDAFHEALKRHGVAPNRVQFLRPLPTSSDIAQFLAQCDIYLDSFPYAGATSLLDPLSVGLPPVAMAGDCLRLAQATAVLTDLGLPELVAADVESYVSLAVALAQDPGRRHGLRQAIVGRMNTSPPPRFLDTQWFSGQCGELFRDLVRERGIL